MKMITAVVRPSRLAPVRAALGFFGVRGLTVSEVLGERPDQLQVGIYRGAPRVARAVPRLRLEILADDADAEDLLHVIITAATSGRVADASVRVTQVEQLVRVRTGERGTDAL